MPEIQGRRPWTSNDDRRTRELHAMGMTLTATARELGRETSVVSRHANRMGLTFAPAQPTAQTAAAREAAREIRRQRRAKLIEGLEEDMVRLRAQLFEETEVFNFGGKDNTFETATIPEPTHADKLKLIQAIQTAGGAIEKLERIDSSDSQHEGVAMLDSIAAAIKGAADALRDPAPLPDDDEDLI